MNECGYSYRQTWIVLVCGMVSPIMEEKRRNRFSPKNPPLRKWRWEGDEFLGKLKLVPEEWGWPAEGEPITDAIASLAISHRNGDTIARYLRQPNPWRHIVLRIADLFDPAKDGVEADRLDFVKRSNKHPMAQRRTDRYHYQIGYGISRMMKSGMKFERAVRKASSEYCVKRTTAIDAYKYYKKEQEREQSTTEKSKMFLTAPD